jgi:hypothetical protein
LVVLAADANRHYASSVDRLVVLLSRVQLEIWSFVTPDVTPSTFSYAFSLLNIPDKSLILKMERVKGIEPSSSAWKAGPSYPEPPQRHKGGAEQTARVRAILADTTAWLKSTWLVR